MCWAKRYRFLFVNFKFNFVRILFIFSRFFFDFVKFCFLIFSSAGDDEGYMLPTFHLVTLMTGGAFLSLLNKICALHNLCMIDTTQQNLSNSCLGKLLIEHILLLLLLLLLVLLLLLLLLLILLLFAHIV
jgi:hypothetical protein